MIFRKYEVDTMKIIYIYCGAYFILWAIYFIVFRDVRLLRGATVDDWYYFLINIPLPLAALIRYGLVIPILLSLHIGWTLRQRSIPIYFGCVLGFSVLFCIISVAFELVFEHRPVALWRFYLVAIPVASLCGGVIYKFISWIVLLISKVDK